MKYLDGVRLTVDKPEYAKHGLKKGARGAIVLPEIRNNTFEVEFFDFKEYSFEAFVGDLEVTQDSELTDAEILKELPSADPRWWCKVENGYIVNLKGEKKNKIPYDYNS